MRPTTPPDDHAELLLYNQYNLAVGCGLFGLFAEGFMLCACLSMWAFWSVKHVKREPWAIQLLAHYQVLACLASSAYWFHLYLDLFVYSTDQLRTLAQGDLIRTVYMVELYIAIPIEFFYAYRCWQLWGKRLALLICLLLGIAGMVGGAVYILSRPGLDYFQILSGVGFWVAVGMLTLTEWTISVTLYLGLRRLRNQTLFHSTRQLVEKLIVWFAEIQLFPSCVVIALVLKTAIKPHIALSAAYCFIPKLWTVTFFVILIAKQVIREDALQQQAQNQMNLDLAQDLTEPGESGGFRSSVNGLVCSLPFLRGSRSSKKDRDSQLEAGLNASQIISASVLPAKGETSLFIPDNSPEEDKDLVVSDFAVQITGVPTTRPSSSMTDDMG